MSSKLGLLDRLFLFRYKITDKIRVSENVDIMYSSDKKDIILKFSYPGNVQYHPMAIDAAVRIADEIYKIFENVSDQEENNG